jgi:hypothetical protein
VRRREEAHGAKNDADPVAGLECVASEPQQECGEATSTCAFIRPPNIMQLRSASPLYSLLYTSSTDVFASYCQQLPTPGAL